MIHFCIEDNYLQLSSHKVEQYNGPEILTQIHADTIVCIYKFWQQYELMLISYGIFFRTSFWI